MPALTLELPEEVEMGEAMRALPEKARAYVIALVTTGCTETSAAIMAGYGEGSKDETQRKNTAHQAVYRLRRTPNVLAAIREETEKRMTAGVAIAANALLAMVADPLNKHHFKAVDRILGQAGMVVATKHEVSVTHKEEQRTDSEILERVKALAVKHGIDLSRLLPAPVVDAEFVVVQTGGSTEGLEDLL